MDREFDRLLRRALEKVAKASEALEGQFSLCAMINEQYAFCAGIPRSAPGIAICRNPETSDDAHDPKWLSRPGVLTVLTPGNSLPQEFLNEREAIFGLLGKTVEIADLALALEQDGIIFPALTHFRSP